MITEKEKHIILTRMNDRYYDVPWWYNLGIDERINLLLVIEGGLKLIELPSEWTSYAHAVDKDGYPVLAWSRDAVKFSAFGAMSCFDKKNFGTTRNSIQARFLLDDFFGQRLIDVEHYFGHTMVARGIKALLLTYDFTHPDYKPKQ